MIPDKIYIRDYKGHGLSNTWRKEPYNYNGYYSKAIENIEYIRKEAVLELLDKLYDDAPSYDDSRVYLGRAFEQINSL